MSDNNTNYRLHQLSKPKKLFAYFVVGWTISDDQQEFIQPQKENKIIELVFVDCKITCFPTRLSEFFPDLKIIRARQCEITSIAKENFSGLPELVRLDMTGNKIKFLSDDVFDNTPKLSHISFRENKLTSIGNKTFVALDKLNFVDLKKNPCFDVLCNDHHNLLTREQLQLYVEKYNRPSSNAVTNLQDSGVKITKELLAMESLKDFTIIANGQKFTAHRIILAAHSEVFMKMFENNPEAKEATIAGITGDSMKAIIDYIYENKLPSENCDAEAIHAAAKKLGIAELQTVTEKKAKQQALINELLETLRAVQSRF